MGAKGRCGVNFDKIFKFNFSYFDTFRHGATSYGARCYACYAQ